MNLLLFTKFENINKISYFINFHKNCGFELLRIYFYVIILRIDYLFLISNKFINYF